MKSNTNKTEMLGKYITQQERDSKKSNFHEKSSLSRDYLNSYILRDELEKKPKKIKISFFNSVLNKNSKVNFYKNNFIVSASPNNGFKEIGVCSYLLSTHIKKIYRELENRKILEGIQIENVLERNEESYTITTSYLSSYIEKFISDINPSPTIIICRPENYILGLIDIFFNGLINKKLLLKRGNKFISNKNESKFNTDSLHPKFRGFEQLIRKLSKLTKGKIRISSKHAGILRGYKINIDNRELTLISRPWGKDMAFLITQKLIEYNKISKILYLGGCGFINDNWKINDLFAPQCVSSVGEKKLDIKNVFLSDFDEDFLKGDLFNVESPVDESFKCLKKIKKAGYSAIEMETYGIKKALENNQKVKFGTLLYGMDLPLNGLDLGKTVYNKSFREKILKGEFLTIKKSFELLNL